MSLKYRHSQLKNKVEPKMQPSNVAAAHVFRVVKALAHTKDQKADRTPKGGLSAWDLDAAASHKIAWTRLSQ